MARPRQYDPDSVLDAAQRVFHEHGYEAASVQDLVDATGLSRSSLYGAFGDKHGLFLAVLDRYVDAGREATDAACCGTSPIGAIRAVLEQSARPEGGCLMINAAAECGARDPETAERAASARRALDARFETLVRQAKAEGQIGARRSDTALAQFLTGAVFGLRALQTSGADAAALAAVVDGALAGLAA